MKDLALNKMFIDIGACSKEEAMKKVNVGDAACFYILHMFKMMII